MKTVSNNIEDDRAARHAATKKEGMDDYTKFIQTQMFVAGLHENIHSRVLESRKTTPHEIFGD